MDIWNDTPRKIVCERSDSKVWKSGGDPDHKLTVGREYELERVDIYDDYTLLSIKGFDEQFNSVLFEEVDGYEYVKDSPSMRAWGYRPEEDRE